MPTYPLAYFITFSTYGTHLHGNKDGSVDRNHNEYGTARIPSQPHLEIYEINKLNDATVVLNQHHRQIVLKSIISSCEYQGWHLFALHVRTNHIHTIVSANVPPEKILHQFKAYATRDLRQIHPAFADIKIWTRHGSTKYLWNRESLLTAMTYVIHKQGGYMEYWCDERV